MDALPVRPPTVVVGSAILLGGAVTLLMMWVLGIDAVESNGARVFFVVLWTFLAWSAYAGGGWVTDRDRGNIRGIRLGMRQRAIAGRRAGGHVEGRRCRQGAGPHRAGDLADAGLQALVRGRPGSAIPDGRCRLSARRSPLYFSESCSSTPWVDFGCTKTVGAPSAINLAPLAFSVSQVAPKSSTANATVWMPSPRRSSA